MTKFYAVGEQEKLKNKLVKLQDMQQNIIFTNGCFDILHAGHVRYLQEARACGDFLVVGLNADVSIQRLKGTSRPVFALEDRQLVLSALSVVDAIMAFDTDTPVSLIQYLEPDVYVKGGDYTVEQLPEYAVVNAYGGAVKILSFYEGFSSSSVIEKLKL
eukprot:COSAG01_NODE_4_length_55812_cov_1344.168109_47_plen_159_part_00